MKTKTIRTCSHTKKDNCKICDEFEKKVKNGELGKGVYCPETKVTTYTTIVKLYLN